MAKLSVGDTVFKARVVDGRGAWADWILVQSTTVEAVNRAGGVTLAERKEAWNWSKRLPMEHAGELTSEDAVRALQRELTADAEKLQQKAAVLLMRRNAKVTVSK